MTQINTTTDAQTSLNVTIEVCAGKYEDYPFPVDTGEFTEFFSNFINRTRKKSEKDR